ncbi:MAG: hypothetical protein EOP06_26585 [Proteobacteria bacterium]|nr:MAG: hypothetical protein EOP06_26585 [Pseudomonadota bacterium]
MPNPTITNRALVSRNAQVAFKSQTVIDGTVIAADGVLKRGQLLVKNSSGTKWHPFVIGDVPLQPGKVRILEDDQQVVAGQDKPCSAFIEGFFIQSDIVQPSTALLASHLIAAAGFLLIEADEIRLK